MRKQLLFPQIGLPSFHGFYDSIWGEMDSYEIEWLAQEHNLAHSDDWRYKDFNEHMQYISEEYARLAISEMNSDLSLHLEMGVTQVWSPREYNFTTDKIYVVVALSNKDRRHIVDLMEKDYDNLKKVIHKHHTSCDGFISFMSNDIDEWLNIIRMGETEDFGLYLGYALYYLWGDKANGFEDCAYEAISCNYVPDVEPDSDVAKREWEKVQIVEEYFGEGAYDPDKMEPWSVKGTKFRCEKKKWESEHLLELQFA